MRAFAGQPVQPYDLGYVNAGCDANIEVTSLDSNDALFAPTVLQYRVDDITNAQGIVPWTTVPTPASVQSIRITAAQNVLTWNYNDTELRRITVKVTDSTGKIGQQVFLYSLVNISTPGLS